MNTANYLGQRGAKVLAVGTWQRGAKSLLNRTVHGAPKSQLYMTVGSQSPWCTGQWGAKVIVAQGSGEPNSLLYRTAGSKILCCKVLRGAKGTANRTAESKVHAVQDSGEPSPCSQSIGNPHSLLYTLLEILNADAIAFLYVHKCSTISLYYLTKLYGYVA